ncbi:MAG: hypothetical protein WC942_09660 [Clostridia bacterium]|jgi:hypothetical protein
MLDIISDTLYFLNKDYGLPVTLFKIVEAVTDITSGEIRRTVSFKHISRALVLPNTLTRRIFNGGPVYDINNRSIVVNTVDIRQLELKIDDYALFNNKQYMITKTVEYDNKQALILEVKEYLGQPITEVFDALSGLNLGANS